MRIPVKNITSGEVDAEGKPILRMSIHIGEGNAILNGKKYPIELLADGEGGVTFVFLEGRDLSGKREVFRVESGSVVPRLLLRPGEDPPDDDELIERAISGLNDLVEISKILGLKDNEGVIDGTLRLVGERAELREQVAELLPEADAKQHFATRALRAEKRISMAREALEAIANMPWGGAPRDLLKELQVVSEALNGPMVLGQSEPRPSEPRPSDAEPSGQGELEELRKRVAYCEKRHRTMSHVESPEDIRVDTELEDDGRWIAEVDNVRGALAYGDTREEAIEAALRVALAEALRQLAKEG